MALTTPPHLESRAIPLLPLCAFMAGYMLNFTFTSTILVTCNPLLKFNIHPVLGSWHNWKVGYIANVSEEHAVFIFALTHCQKYQNRCVLNHESPLKLKTTYISMHYFEQIHRICDQRWPKQWSDRLYVGLEFLPY